MRPIRDAPKKCISYCCHTSLIHFRHKQKEKTPFTKVLFSQNGYLLVWRTYYNIFFVKFKEVFTHFIKLIFFVFHITPRGANLENKKAKIHLPTAVYHSLTMENCLFCFYYTTITLTLINHYCDSNKLRQGLQSKAWELRSSGRRMRRLSAVYSPFAQADKIPPLLFVVFRLRKAKGETPIPKHSNSALTKKYSNLAPAFRISATQ